MNNTNIHRVDEVDKYYKPIKTLGNFSVLLFWIIAALSLFIPYSKSVVISSHQPKFVAVYIVLVVLHFVLSQISRFYLVPRAERMRRKQLLTNAFGAQLSHDQTCLYYNNQCPPSIKRLGANTMENALFSKEIAGKMLIKNRMVTGGYLITWLLAFSFSHDNMEILTWITQIVFSGEIVVQWVNLEILRLRHSRTYELLHIYFLHQLGQDSNKSIATLLDAFVAYESAKSSAGILLSTKIFQKLNPTLSVKWNQIRQELKIDFQHGA